MINYMNKDLKWIKENDLHLKREVECNIEFWKFWEGYFTMLPSSFFQTVNYEYTLVTVSEFCFKMLLRIPFTEKVRFTLKKRIAFE